jgi:hypothetical protein
MNAEAPRLAGLEDYYDPMRDPTRQDTGFVCAGCGEECQPKVIDVGNGPCEYWGYKFNDVQLVVASDCCEDTVLDEEGEEVTELPE